MVRADPPASTALALDGAADWSPSQLRKRPPRAPRGASHPSLRDRDAADSARLTEHALSTLPPDVVDRIAGDSALAAQQVPDPGRRRELIASILRACGGADGRGITSKMGTLADFAVFARGRGVDVLRDRCTAMLIMDFLDTVARQNRGPTVAVNARAALVFFATHFKFDLDVANDATAAVAPKPTLAPRTTGTLALVVVCKLERLSDPRLCPDLNPYARLWARSVLICFLCCFRIKEGVIAYLLTHYADGSRVPDDVIAGKTVYKQDAKKGVELAFYAPAIGVLGPLWWYPEYRDELAAMHSRSVKPVASIFPEWLGPTNKSRVIALANRWTESSPTVEVARNGFYDVLELAGITAADRRRFDIRGHILHGSSADVLRYLGDCTPVVEKGFTKDDMDEIGHWRRISAGGGADGSVPQPLPLPPPRRARARVRLVAGLLRDDARDGEPRATRCAAASSASRSARRGVDWTTLTLEDGWRPLKDFVVRERAAATAAASR